MHWFVGSLVRWSVGRLFICSVVGWIVCLLVVVHWFDSSFVCWFIGLLGRWFIGRLFIHSIVHSSFGTLVVFSLVCWWVVSGLTCVLPFCGCFETNHSTPHAQHSQHIHFHTVYMHIYIARKFSSRSAIVSHLLLPELLSFLFHWYVCPSSYS